MEIRVLRYFLTVVREENITKAAKLLHITQPTLSRQLMQLENELGTQLFRRGKNKITLTNQGMLLRRRAEEIINLTDKTQKEFCMQEDLIGGEIHIGSGETNTMRFLADIMKSFHQQYPSVKFDLFSGNADDIKEKIDKGLIDIGLLTEPVDISKYDFVRLPQKDAWGIVMRKDDILTKKEFITATDLRGKDIMFSRRAIVQNELTSWFGNLYNYFNVVATYNLIYNATLMVESGMGYAVCLEKLVYSNPNNQVCFRLFEPRLETGTVLVWKKHQVFSPATSRFIELIRNAFKAY